MRQLRVLAVLSVFLGVVSLSIPLSFYTKMSRIYGTLDPAPFNFAVARTFAIVFALPAITLIIMGLSLYYILEELEKIGSYRSPSNDGGSRTHSRLSEIKDTSQKNYLLEEDEVQESDIISIGDDTVVNLPSNEFDKKEIYSEAGEFLGYAKNVSIDSDGDVISFDAVKKDLLKEIQINDVLSVGKVIIVKA